MNSSRPPASSESADRILAFDGGGGERDPADDDLARSYRASTAPTERSACPEAEVLACLAAGELGSAEKTAVVDHVAGCAECAAELQSLRRSPELAPAAAGDPDGASPQAPETRGTPRGAWLLAASLLAVLGLLGVWFLTQPAIDPVRSGVEVGVQGSPAPDARLERAPAELSWTGLPGATYTVRLMTAEGEVLLEREVTATGEELTYSVDLATLPDSRRRLLEEGGRFFWVAEEVDGASRLGPSWFVVEGAVGEGDPPDDRR